MWLIALHLQSVGKEFNYIYIINTSKVIEPHFRLLIVIVKQLTILFNSLQDFNYKFC